MTLKQIAINKLKECDIINDKIYNLRKKENEIRNEISLIKKAIEKENAHLIGKYALCSKSNGEIFKQVKCKCTYIECNNDFNIVPYFTKDGKRVKVDYYKFTL